ncbi:MAG: cell division protein SepF [Lachnospiraceae bacterium]|nr:cell division protein SepF [Lachnospiraceae bacterium]
MGGMDRFLNLMRLNPQEEDDYYDDYEEDEEVQEEKPKKSLSVKEKTEPQESEKPRKLISKPSAITKTRRTSNGMEVCVIKPTSVEDGREITDTLLANQTVVLNLEGLEVGIAQRIIDFTSGSTYAISGNLQKISQYIFIVTPPSVNISGDFPEIMSGNFDVPF